MIRLRVDADQENPKPAHPELAVGQPDRQVAQNGGMVRNTSVALLPGIPPISRTGFAALDMERLRLGRGAVHRPRSYFPETVSSGINW
jgi:hypothetical protein